MNSLNLRPGLRNWSAEKRRAEKSAQASAPEDLHND